MNRYGEKCPLHNKEMGLYCKICLSYKCNMCEDEHYRKGGVFPSCSILKYSKCINYKDDIAKQANAIRIIYTNALQALEASYTVAMEEVATLELIGPNTQVFNEMSIHHFTKSSIEHLKSAIIGLPQNDDLTKYMKNITTSYQEIKKIAESICRRRSSTSQPKKDETIYVPVIKIEEPVKPEELDENSSSLLIHRKASSSHGESTSLSPMRCRDADEGKKKCYTPFKNNKMNVEIPSVSVKHSNFNTSVIYIPKRKTVNSPMFYCPSKEDNIKESDKANVVEEMKSEESKLTDDANLQFAVPYFKTTTCNQMIIYYPKTEEAKIIVFDENINEACETIKADNRIFLIGGFDSVAISKVFEADVINKKLIKKEKIPTAKYEHSLCETNSYIYSIGGGVSVKANDKRSVREKPSSYCEKYSIKDNTWVQLPNLESPRRWAASIAYSRSYIFVFFGLGNRDIYLDSVESLEISNPVKWKIVETKLPSSISVLANLSFELTYSMHGAQINENSGIIYGGINNTTLSSQCCLITFINSHSIQLDKLPSMKLSTEGYFNDTTAPLLIDGKIYDIDYTRKLHIFDIAEKRWVNRQQNYYSEIVSKSPDKKAAINSSI